MKNFDHFGKKPRKVARPFNSNSMAVCVDFARERGNPCGKEECAHDVSWSRTGSNGFLADNLPRMSKSGKSFTKK
jgi:hypothetical protein